MSSWLTMAFQRSARVTRGWTWSFQGPFSNQTDNKYKERQKKPKSTTPVTGKLSSHAHDVMEF